LERMIFVTKDVTNYPMENKCQEQTN